MVEKLSRLFAFYHGSYCLNQPQCLGRTQMFWNCFVRIRGWEMLVIQNLRTHLMNNSLVDSEAYLELCQASVGEGFAKIVYVDKTKVCLILM